MHFINDDMRNLVQKFGMRSAAAHIVLQAAQEDTDRTKVDRASDMFSRLCIEPNLIANRVADDLAAFSSNTISDGDGCNTSRLSANDVAFGTATLHCFNESVNNPISG